MTNTELWGHYVNYTVDLSNNARKLGFAGAAIAWLFKTDQSTFPVAILAALFFIITFFILDILQYFLGAVVLKFWLEDAESKIEEKTGSIDGGNYSKPRYVDYPPFTCWVGKITSLLIGYVCLGVQIFL